MPFNSNFITINFTFINMLLRWLQQQFIDEHATWQLMKIGIDRGLLKLESSMYVATLTLGLRPKQGLAKV